MTPFFTSTCRRRARTTQAGAGLSPTVPRCSPSSVQLCALRASSPSPTLTHLSAPYTTYKMLSLAGPESTRATTNLRAVGVHSQEFHRAVGYELVAASGHVAGAPVRGDRALLTAAGPGDLVCAVTLTAAARPPSVYGRVARSASVALASYTSARAPPGPGGSIRESDLRRSRCVSDTPLYLRREISVSARNGLSRRRALGLCTQPADATWGNQRGAPPSSTPPPAAPFVRRQDAVNRRRTVELLFRTRVRRARLFGTPDGLGVALFCAAAYDG